MHSPDDHDRILETDHFHALAGIDIAIDRFSLRRDLSYTHFAHRCQARQRGTGLADQDIILLGGGGRRGLDRGFQRQVFARSEIKTASTESNTAAVSVTRPINTPY